MGNGDEHTTEEVNLRGDNSPREISAVKDSFAPPNPKRKSFSARLPRKISASLNLLPPIPSSLGPSSSSPRENLRAISRHSRDSHSSSRSYEV